MKELEDLARKWQIKAQNTEDETMQELLYDLSTLCSILNMVLSNGNSKHR
jgi:hypothetical protein